MTTGRQIVSRILIAALLFGASDIALLAQTAATVTARNSRIQGRMARLPFQRRGGYLPRPWREKGDYRGLGAYGFPPSAFEMSAIAFCAFTLFPALSRGGEMTAIPNLPGETAMIPPPTPLLAGSPVA